MPKSKQTKLKSSKVNFKSTKVQLLATALIFAVIGGGFLLYKSFAATALNPYQFSVAKCTATVTKVGDQPCIDASAEFWVYRLYKGLEGREPDANGYQFWTQTLAGNREKPSRVTERFVGASSKAKAGSNKEFVVRSYKNFYGRDGDAAGITYWTNQLDTKARTRSEVAVVFLKNDSAINSAKKTFPAYKSKNAVKVTETARAEQEKRSTEAKNINYVTKQVLIDKMASKSKENDAKKVEAGTVANKSTISSADLQKIKKNVEFIEANFREFKGWKTKADENARSVKKLYDDAVAVTAYSPDITNANITNAWKVAQSYQNNAQSYVDNASWLAGETHKAYKTAENKLNAQNAAAAAAANRPSGGGGGISVGSGGSGRVPPGLNPGACSTALANINQGSGKNCIAKLQQAGGVTVDGIWGPQTQGVANYINGSTNKGSVCQTNPGSQACRDALAAALSGGSGSGGTNKPVATKNLPYMECRINKEGRCTKIIAKTGNGTIATKIEVCYNRRVRTGFLWTSTKIKTELCKQQAGYYKI
jgi:hypothetical protein